jgi:hypothetical protein
MTHWLVLTYYIHSRYNIINKRNALCWLTTYIHVAT